MKRPILLVVSIVVSLVVLLASARGAGIGRAQDLGPVVDILGEPQAPAGSADIVASVSVVDPNTGGAIDGLGDGDFRVQVSGEDVAATVVPQDAGVAVVIVIDRGGIARSGDTRIKAAAELAQGLLDELVVDGSENADMVALIGIRGRQEQEWDLTPLVPFIDRDPNQVRNEITRMTDVNEVVPETTPLYDGVDQAIEWLVRNPDPAIQEKLENRRRIIVVFSDGIDRKFSDKSHEATISSECRENGILLYAVWMRGATSEQEIEGFKTMATQTRGIFITYAGDTHDDVVDLLDTLSTQRRAYQVTFPLHRQKGDYNARIQVTTSIGAGDDEVMVASRLLLPQVSLSIPQVSYTVPYSHTPRVYIPLSVTLTYPDDVVRTPTEVRYYRSGALIATSTTPPFTADWDATDYITQTQESRTESFTFGVEADDPYLGETTKRAEMNVEVTWEPLPPAPPPTILQQVLGWLATFWWVILLLAFLGIGFLVVLILLIRTRGEMARKMMTRTTGVLKGITRRLGGMPQQAPGKLVIVQGPGVGREFRLIASVVKVGRDPQFCDFALFDDYVSNPHFSVQQEQTKFFIVDEGSTNGTRVNGAPIPVRQRMVLQPDAFIEVGQTKLQFKRLGGTTRQLGKGTPQPPAQRPSAPPPAQRPSAPPPSPPPHPPTRPQTPPAPQAAPAPQAPPTPQAAPAAPRRGGPTVKLPEEDAQAAPAPQAAPTPQVAPRRGGPTVKLPEEDTRAPGEGGPTVKLPEEG